ncbi:MAG TPA: glycosyltransferase family 2 protein, partial [Polyangiaceae bacterium]|nr:glycosyltransferase family 2 protein [Polyangiaceae bacterium]
GDVAAAPAVAAMTAPLVSCIMPTADRRHFVAHGIRNFLAQDHPERELVIVDDGVDAIEDLVPHDARIRYVRLARRLSIGEKRNTACAMARGAFIAHFDDDDWSSPHRLSYQLADLESAGADLAGLARMHYLEPASGRAWQYRYPAGARRWVAGNTLIYRRERWQARPFEAVDVGEDARFVWAGRSTAIHAHASSDFFVAMIHGANAGPKRVRERFWRAEPTAVVQALMGADYEVYRALPAAKVA